ncbi:MAG: hypothetical protein AB8G11_09365, partial [Saprospiraceae bacterium]
TKANFTQIANDILLDQRLSFKARGILVLLLSRPKNWKIYIDEIIERSDLDGKHSVRTGFKELKALGYVKLVRVWNKATRKFEGTIYQLSVESLNVKPLKFNGSTVAKNDLPKSEKTDIPKISTSENPPDNKPDRQKTMIHNNTNSSNTKHSNIIIQQQQAKIDDDDFLKFESIPVAAASAAVLKNITAAEAAATGEQTATPLLPFLAKDEIWKKQFIGQDICKQIGTSEILTAPKFELLLKHFGQTSIPSGTTYANIAAIKRHFFNWFNANLNKNALSNYIEQQTKAPKKAHKQVAEIKKKTNAILNKIYTQQCDNEAHLYRCLQLLATHSAIYENALSYLDLDNQKAVNTWITDIEHAKNLVERGRKAGQLYWFCAKKNSSKVQSKLKNQTFSVMLNSFQHLPDSKFVV